MTFDFFKGHKHRSIGDESQNQADWTEEKRGT
jgi:hypothetical protein